MARGWESKSIESQQQDRAEPARITRELSASEREALERRRGLELARARTLADLEVSRSPHHRSMLQQALRTIDEQLSRFPGPAGR